MYTHNPTWGDFGQAIGLSVCVELYQYGWFHISCGGGAAAYPKLAAQLSRNSLRNLSAIAPAAYPKRQDARPLRVGCAPCPTPAKLRASCDPTRTRGRPFAFTGAHPFALPVGGAPPLATLVHPSFPPVTRLRAATPRSRATAPFPSHYDPHPLRSALERSLGPLNGSRAQPTPPQRPTTAR